ncbi:hypothetical protein AMTR_s00014p00238410 [Amborella trichopoda]|uniref:Uncharacterized protein n=1 Tax=Amborella trichopoda TaxID=13333 RepID=W1PNB2_AMBTC|nr:hypothetical protein AMTR_s00014p00238410 [Amborella trichopoda]
MQLHAPTVHSGKPLEPQHSGNGGLRSGSPNARSGSHNVRSGSALSDPQRFGILRTELRQSQCALQ